jgi:hypothetical protein
MFKRVLIFMALRLIKTLLLDKITYAPAKAYIGGVYGRLEKVATIFTDSNPEDDNQLRDLWEAEKGQFIVDSINATQEIITIEVDNPVVRDILLEALQAIEDAQLGVDGHFRVIAA